MADTDSLPGLWFFIGLLIVIVVFILLEEFTRGGIRSMLSFHPVAGAVIFMGGRK